MEDNPIRKDLGMAKVVTITKTLDQALKGDGVRLFIHRDHGTIRELRVEERYAFLLRAARNVEQALMQDEGVVLERVTKVLEGHVVPGTSLYDLTVAVIQAVMVET